MNLDNFKQERFNLYFDELKKHIGEKVVVEFVFTYKEEPLLYKNPAILHNVYPFKMIHTIGIFCPKMAFIGPEYSIVRITTQHGKVIYDCTQILEYLPIRPINDNLNDLSFKIFGSSYFPVNQIRKINCSRNN